MSKLINSETLKKSLCKQCLRKNGCTRSEDEFCERMDNFVDSIPTGWIRCQDRLPEKEGRYLVTVLTEDSLIVDIATYDTKTYTWTRWFPMGYSIAWMPLPEPYKMDEVTE